MIRLSDIDRAMKLQRLEAVGERITGLEAGIERLKEQGHSTVEAERLLYLLRQSRVNILRQVDLAQPSS